MAPYALHVLISYVPCTHFKMDLTTKQQGPLLLDGLALIPARISKYIHYKVWDKITYPFQNFNGCTVEV